MKKLCSLLTMLIFFVTASCSAHEHEAQHASEPTRVASTISTEESIALRITEPHKPVNLDDWIGFYGFEEISNSNIYQYSIRIKDENSRDYYGVYIELEIRNITLDEPYIEAICTFNGNETYAELMLDHFRPWRHGNGTISRNEPLLTLIKRGQKIYTKWGSLRPFNKENLKEGIYFKKY